MPATLPHAEVQPQLLERLLEARRRSDELFAIVKPDSLFERPIAERHRIIFYIGHLEAFDWNLLSERAFGLKRFQPELDRLFAFGIDPVGGGLPDDQPSDWPRLDEVQGYASRIRQILDYKVANAGYGNSHGEFPLHQLLNVAIEHRLMHAETLAYMLHQLPLERKVLSSETSPNRAQEPLAQTMIEIPAGRATLGMARSDEEFGWDNEYEAQTLDVPAFAIDKFEVTNGQFLEFLRAGGYETRTLWSEDDWKWRSEKNISHPAFWKRSGDGWLYRGMFEEQPLPPSAPVYVSLAEARAYAAWAGKDLPTEGEWHRAAFADKNGGERAYPWGNTWGDNTWGDNTWGDNSGGDNSGSDRSWGDAAAGAALGNFDFAGWNPTAVSAFPAGESAFGVADLMGNGWEWTSTAFAPLPGFQPFPFYPGYSADFFDGKHFVLKGGSPRTAACMVRRSFRNWFQPHYQYVYAGFRCVQR